MGHRNNESAARHPRGRVEPSGPDDPIGDGWHENRAANIAAECDLIEQVILSNPFKRWTAPEVNAELEARGHDPIHPRLISRRRKLIADSWTEATDEDRHAWYARWARRLEVTANAAMAAKRLGVVGRVAAAAVSVRSQWQAEKDDTREPSEFVQLGINMNQLIMFNSFNVQHMHPDHPPSEDVLDEWRGYMAELRAMLALVDGVDRSAPGWPPMWSKRGLNAMAESERRKWGIS